MLMLAEEVILSWPIVIDAEASYDGWYVGVVRKRTRVPPEKGRLANSIDHTSTQLDA